MMFIRNFGLFGGSLASAPALAAPDVHLADRPHATRLDHLDHRRSCHRRESASPSAVASLFLAAISAIKRASLTVVRQRLFGK